LDNEYIDIKKINLLPNEKIVEIKIDYGEVGAEFSNIEKPQIFIKVDNNVKKEDKIINKTKLLGMKDGYETLSEDEYITTIKEKEILKKLPKTGF